MIPRTPLVLVVVVVALVVAARPSPSRAADPRSTVLFDRDCASSLGRRDLTLYANGTIRLIEGLKGKEKMRLGELDPDHLEGFRRRLAQVDLDDAESMGSPVGGRWVEKCLLSVRRNGIMRKFQFSRYDTLPLALEQLTLIGRDLAAQVSPEGSDRHLPVDYKPRIGDVLERVDGHRFEVVGFTSDGKGVELEGETDPLTLYLTVQALRHRFVALVSRRLGE